MPVKVYGAVQMDVKMKKLSDDAWTAIINAVRKFEQEELNEMLDLVPVRSGELYESGAIVEPVRVGNSIIGGIYFSADHAIFVHEDLEAFHDQGQAKFMEQPLRESERHFGSRVAEDVAKELL